MSTYVKTGTETGTGAAINVNCGFVPSMVELFCSESSAKCLWDDSLSDGQCMVTEISEVRTGEVLIGKHLPLIGTTDTQLANTRCVGYFDGAGATAIEIAATAAGTAFTATTHDVATGSKWGGFLLSIQTGGTITITPTAALNYSTEALAIAAKPSVPANEIELGFVTIQSTSGAIWNATTDALYGGSSGTPAAATNYYAAVAIMSNGITPRDYDDTFRGFTIGTSALLNVTGSLIYYKAYR